VITQAVPPGRYRLIAHSQLAPANIRSIKYGYFGRIIFVSGDCVRAFLIFIKYRVTHKVLSATIDISNTQLYLPTHRL